MQIVQDLMTRELVTLSRGQAVGEVRDVMLSSGIHCLPILDDDGHALGVVTSWDLVEDFAADDSILKAMTTRVVTIGPDEPVSEAAAIMMTNWIHHLVVTGTDGRVEGLLSSFDLLGLVAEEQVA